MRKIVLCAFALYVCASSAVAQPQFAATIPPLRSIVEQIAEGRAEVVGLLPAGSSPHTFDPRPSDMRAAHEALAVIYIADDLDGWALRIKPEPAVKAIGFLPESLQLELLEECREHGDHEHHHHHGQLDPHFWLDPLAIKAVVPGLRDALAGFDPEGKAVYERNAEVLMSELDELHAEIEQTLKPVLSKVVMLSHPFNHYYLHRYGIRSAGVLEPIPGKEPTPRRIVEFIERVKTESVSALLVKPQLSERPARVLAESAGLPLAEIDPLGGTPGRGSYQELLRYNTRTLLKALQ